MRHYDKRLCNEEKTEAALREATERMRAREKAGKPACECGHHSAEYVKFTGPHQAERCCKGRQITHFHGG